MAMQRKSIVLSGVSIDSGGPLTIYKDLLSYLSNSEYADKYDIVAIVHDEKLFKDIPNVRYISIPKADNWILRLYYEYFGFKKISKNLNSYLWLSLQVATPNVKTENQALYMHNPSPFYKWKLSDFNYGSRYILFAIFFKYIYKINLKKNNYLIVQQAWLRNEFSRMYNVSAKKIIVSYPNDNKKDIEPLDTNIEMERANKDKYLFFYPALPRIFKNYEVICEAVKILNSRKVDNFEVSLTIDGSENKYSHSVVKKYSNVPNIGFLGLIPHQKVMEYYKESDCLIFPSKLETWGLPISEFSVLNKPMLVADLPYAHETATGSRFVSFFDVNDPQILAQKMEKLINGDYSDLSPVAQGSLQEPCTSSWAGVFDILMK